ncbi:MAG TPA: hypothetical protein VM911_10040 [Pyrinomonadaceae bacterium]|jgi:hypothetical protein|nr:hypothetical protein [Pyrinomonadaceae bacterium]
MPEKSPIRYIAAYFAWFLIGAAILIALPFLLWSQLIGEHSIWRDIVRDIGIAFMVAAIVAAIYELYARSRFDIETMKGVLDTTIGEIIRPDIWQEVKGQVIERDMIRQNVDIHLRIEAIGDEVPGLAILSLQFDYDLYGLHSRPIANLTLMHYLDAHIKPEDTAKYEHIKDLPKFEYLKVGNKEYPVAPLPTSNIKDGRFTEQISLGPKDAEPVRIVTRRRECTYIPGSYNLTMGELTKGITLHLTEVPDNVEVSVNLRPHTEFGVPLRLDEAIEREFRDTILLPGQTIEFRFKHKRKAAHEQSQAATVASGSTLVS